MNKFKNLLLLLCWSPFFRSLFPSAIVGDQNLVINEGLAGETQVQTPFGLRKLKALGIGDIVRSFDFEKNQLSDALIIEVQVSIKKTNLIKFKIDNKWICAESDQTFYNLNKKEWIAAKDLKVGTLLARTEKENKLLESPVQEVLLLSKKSDQKTIALTLDKRHNFVVGSGVIVHNKKLWDEKTGGFVDEKTSSGTGSIDSSNGCLPTISGGPSPHEIILNALLEFQHYPQMLDRLRQEEALENEAQQAHKTLIQSKIQEEAFLATKIRLASLAAPECARKARLLQEFQTLVSHGKPPKTVGTKNLDAQESFILLQKTFVDNPIKLEALENLESNLFSELHHSLDNVILPDSVESDHNGFPMDIFGSAVALSLSIILGLGSIGPMLSVINYCQNISLKLLFHRVVFAELLFFPWPVAYKVDGLFPDQSAVVLQSLGKGFGLKSLLDTLKVASSRMASVPALTQAAKESIKVASATSLMSIICPYIIPVALTAMIVKAAVSACQTEMGKAAIESTKSFIASLGDKLVETVVNVAQYFGVGPTVAGFVQTDVEKSKEVKAVKSQEVAPRKNVIPEWIEQWKEKTDFWETADRKIENRSEIVKQRGAELKNTVFDIPDVLDLKGNLKIEFETKVKKTFHHWKYINCRSRIYKAEQDFESFGIKAGCYFYLDLSLGHYGDHIEVFNEQGRVYDVRNLDGTKDEFKTEVAFDRIKNYGTVVPANLQKPREIKEGSLRLKFCENNGCEDCIKNG